jgi:hypothetical protein
MKSLKVVGDPKNTPSCSSEIIISNLNNGLKKLGLYNEDGVIVVYDCLGQSHGYNSDFIICPYETSIPKLVIDNAQGRNLIGVSHQNQAFFIDGGYPKEKTFAMTLGVDSQLWRPKNKSKNKSVFRFGMCCDSNTRAAYPELLMEFGMAFAGRTDVELYIKDRWATEVFRTFVKTIASTYNVIIHHDDVHVMDKDLESDIYDTLDCHVFLNKTSTFALTVSQGMAMQKPTIVMDYSGPRDYCNELNACICSYSLQDIEPWHIMTLQRDYGLRNYLLTNPALFRQFPKWAAPNLKSIRTCMFKVLDDKEYREQIAYKARATSEGMTWDRAALNLFWIVNK